MTAHRQRAACRAACLVFFESDVGGCRLRCIQQPGADHSEQLPGYLWGATAARDEAGVEDESPEQRTEKVGHRVRVGVQGQLAAPHRIHDHRVEERVHTGHHRGGRVVPERSPVVDARGDHQSHQIRLSATEPVHLCDECL